MGKPEINIYRRAGGLGRVGNNERKWSGLVMGGVAVSGTLSLNTVYELNSVNDARNLGIDEAYDTANTVLCFYHISEFFRMCPDGKLFIMVVAQSTTLTSMGDKTNTTNGLVKLLRDPKCQGKIRQAAIAKNPASGYTPTVADGIESDVIAVSAGVYSGAVVKLQALAEEERTLKRPVQMIVEARAFGGTSSSLIDGSAANCPKVYMCMAADYDVSSSNSRYAGHAAVGTLLGHRANISSCKSIAYVAIGNIQDVALGKFVNPGLSSGTKLSAFTDTVNGDQDVILSKGFVIPRIFQGGTEVYFNKDITATAGTDDFYRGANSMVVNEAERLVYKTMKPHIEEDLPVDATTGQLPTILTKAWESECEDAINKTLKNDISGVTAYIDPAQNFLSTDEIKIEISIVPKGYASTINVYIGLENPYSA